MVNSRGIDQTAET